MLKMILATGVNGELGCDNKLLDYIPEDLAHFKEHTLNQVVVMGRKTFDSLPFEGGLPNRKNTVLTSRLVYPHDLYENVSFIYELDTLKLWLDMFDTKDAWIVGGASIYEQFKDVVSEIHHTQINKSYPEADVHFSMGWVLDETKFECVSKERLCDIATVFVYKRKGQKTG